MVKKLFISFNVFLVILFAYGIIALYAELTDRKIVKYNIADYDFMKIERPTLDISGKYDSLFGIKRPDILQENISSKVENSINSTDELNQLFVGEKIIRVQGIFISEDRRRAAILIKERDGGDKGSSKTQKIKIGDMVDVYKVVSIFPEFIVLSHPTTGILNLQIFKPTYE